MQGAPAPAGTGSLTDVSCADARHCWAVGVADPDVTSNAIVIVATTDGGATWKNQPLTSAATPALTGVSCPTVSDCMAVGSTAQGLGAGVVLTTHNGGASWSTLTPPAGAFQMIAVQCTSAADCRAIVNDGTFTWSALTTTFGRTWQRQGNLPTGLEGIDSLDCTGTTCLVVGYSPTTAGHGQGSIAISTDGAATWAAADVPTGMGVLHWATCPTPAHCLAVGTTSSTVSDVIPAQGQVLASLDAGHTWAVAPTSSPIQNIYGIVCPTTTTCAMVGTKWVGTPVIGSGAVAQSIDGGVHFVAAKAAYIPLSLTALACPASTSCIAVGGDTVARITLPAPKVTVAPERHRRAPIR